MDEREETMDPLRELNTSWREPRAYGTMPRSTFVQGWLLQWKPTLFHTTDLYVVQPRPGGLPSTGFKVESHWKPEKWFSFLAEDKGKSIQVDMERGVFKAGYPPFLHPCQEWKLEPMTQEEVISMRLACVYESIQVYKKDMNVMFQCFKEKKIKKRWNI